MIEGYSSARGYIKINEGLRLKLYKCSAGKTTIGWGRNLDDRGISLDEAGLMLSNDINDSVKSLLKIFGYSRLQCLSKNRQIVLIDMMFNMGETQFLEFKKMIRAVKNNDFEEAARQIKDSKYFRRFRSRANQNMKLMWKG